MDVRECFYCIEALEMLADEVEKQNSKTTEVSLRLLVEAIRKTIKRIEEIG